MEKETTFRPIGYWVKTLDRLIESELDAALAGHGLTRRGWQIMNLLRRGAHSREELVTELASFDGGGGDVEGALETLVGSGLVEARGETTLALTADGRSRLDEAGSTVGATRSRIAEGLTQDDYDTTVRTLATMCRNLGWRGE